MAGFATALEAMGRPARRPGCPAEDFLQRSEGQSLPNAALADHAARGESRDSPPRPSLRFPAGHGSHAAAAGPDRILPDALGVRYTEPNARTSNTYMKYAAC